MTSSKVDGGEAVPSFFPKLDADNDDITEMDSLCMKCFEQGVTKLMLTRIPFFKEVIISSFHCDACGHSDNSIQSGGCIQEKGMRYSVQIRNEADLNRQIVLSEYASFFLPQFEFEQPAARKAAITTVEGILESVYADLLIFQPERREVDPDVATKVDEFLEKLMNLKTLEASFEIVVDDPSGNSFIENPSAPKRDDQMSLTHYIRSTEQDALVGIMQQQPDSEPVESSAEKETEVKGESYTQGKVDLTNEVLQFGGNCCECNAPCQTNMKLVDIPYFKQVVIMAVSCDACGYRDNEVKGASGIEDEGVLIDLRLTHSKDLDRDVLKSDSCMVRIPELELELMEGTLGGKFTTIEGLLTNIVDQLGQKNPFVVGDSSHDDTQAKVNEFCERLNKVIKGEMLDVHFILDDPAGNSYLQNLYSPDDDPEMKVTHYKRTYEQNEDLGLNDMKTENYQNDADIS